MTLNGATKPMEWTEKRNKEGWTILPFFFFKTGPLPRTPCQPSKYPRPLAPHRTSSSSTIKSLRGHPRSGPRVVVRDINEDSRSTDNPRAYLTRPPGHSGLNLTLLPHSYRTSTWVLIHFVFFGFYDLPHRFSESPHYGLNISRPESSNFLRPPCRRHQGGEPPYSERTTGHIILDPKSAKALLS